MFPSIRKYRINELAIIILFICFFYFFKKESNLNLQSKYLLNISSNNVLFLLILQVLGIIGFIIWFINIRITPPNKGILSYNFLDNPMYEVTVFFILFGYILWILSLNQTDLIENKTILKSLFCCIGLFIAAICGIIIQAGCFEADNISLLSLIGITIFNTTIVLNNGIGWNARLIYQTLYKNYNSS